MAGVGAVLGVVLGVVDDPPDPLEPLAPPPMFGQSALVPVWVRGVVVPPFDGAVVVPSEGATVLGDAEGPGLAAETTATPPATSSRPEIAAVRIAAANPIRLGLDRRDRDRRDGFDRCRYERLECWFHAYSLLSAGSPLWDEPHPERGERA